MKAKTNRLWSYESYLEIIELTQKTYTESQFARIGKAGLSVLRRGRLSGDRSCLKMEAYYMFKLGADRFEVAHRLGKSVEWANEVAELKNDELALGLLDKRIFNGLRFDREDDSPESPIFLLTPLTRDEYEQELRRLRNSGLAKSTKFSLRLKCLVAILRAAKSCK